MRTTETAVSRDISKEEHCQEKERRTFSPQKLRKQIYKTQNIQQHMDVRLARLSSAVVHCCAAAQPASSTRSARLSNMGTKLGERAVAMQMSGTATVPPVRSNTVLL
jgi:hypothetical protein